MCVKNKHEKYIVYGNLITQRIIFEVQCLFKK